MENKFEVFIEVMENLKNEKIKKECKSMIVLARRYYTYYFQFKKLETVKRKLANIYCLSLKSKEKRITIRKGELDIEYRLFIEFYKKVIQKTYPMFADNDIDDFILEKDFKDNLDQFEYKFKDYKIGKNSLYGWIEKSCAKARKCYHKKRQISLGMDNIREAMQIYSKYKDISGFSEITEETSFNEVYSEDYVNLLSEIMKADERVLRIYLAPVRAQLCKKEEGGREINSRAWKWCFNKDFRLSLSQLEDEIRLIKEYEKTYGNYVVITKELETIEREIFTLIP